MKTIYIDEKILKNKKLQESIYSDTFSEKITNKILNNKTSLGNNPSIPDIFDTPFLLKVTEEGFNNAKDNLKLKFNFDEIKEKELEPILSKLILKCKELEKPFRSELEKMCLNYVIDLFEIPEDTVDIKLSLCDEIDLNKSVILLDPTDDEYEYKSFDEAVSIKGEIYKRRLLNALCMGGAMIYSNSNFEENFPSIKKLNPELIELYQKIITLNYYLLYIKDDFVMTDENKMQIGTVEVHLGNDTTKALIEAQGVIMPILLTEIIRGFMELFISHGLPKEKNIALSVIKKTDFLKAEPWDMKFGPVLWNKFSKTFNDINSEELPYLLKRVSKLKVDNFNTLFKEIFANTKKGKEIMASISNKSKNDINYDKFVDKMDKLKSEKGIITDDYIHPDEF